MLEIKKYMDIIRYGKRGTEDVLKQGDMITITEKLDFANASFRVDNTNELGVSCYSRNITLDNNNTLGGFYEWVKDNIIPIKNKLNPNYIYFGEWSGVKHKVLYKDEVYNRFWTFSVYDIIKEEYLSDEIVLSECKRLGLDHVPYFYIGEFISYEHMMEFVGKSELTKETNTGEGIVIKNVNYRDRFSNQCFVKIVSDKFAEFQNKKPKSKKESKELLVISSVLTKPRVEKILYKMIDDNEINSDYGIEDMGNILKIISPKVYCDIIKEESDLFAGFDEKEIKKIIFKKTPVIVKEIMKEQNRI